MPNSTTSTPVLSPTDGVPGKSNRTRFDWNAVSAFIVTAMGAICLYFDTVFGAARRWSDTVSVIAEATFDEAVKQAQEQAEAVMWTSFSGALLGAALTIVPGAFVMVVNSKRPIMFGLFLAVSSTTLALFFRICSSTSMR